MQNIVKRLFAALITLIFAQFLNAQSDFIDTGVASYYAEKFHGRKTASGELYDMNLLTAAHPTLPFNTMVKVTNLKNKKSVVVRINDRGPFAKNRIIDLSKAAATKIGIIQSGLGNVRIEVIKPDKKVKNKTNPSSSTELKPGNYYTPDKKEAPISGFFIQSSSFSDLKKVKTHIANLKKSGYAKLFIEPASVKNKIVYRVLVGSFDSKEKAESELKNLKKKGYSGFVRCIK